MKFYLLINCFFVYCIATISAERFSYDGYKVWSVSPTTVEQIEKLHSWEAVPDVDFWNELNQVGKPVRIMIAPNLQYEFENFLQTEQIANKIVIENVKDVLENERQEQDEANERSKGRATLDFEHYWTSDEINDYMNYLVNFHGDVCRAQVVGHTIQGQLLRVMKISQYGEVDGSRPIIYIDAGVHAREWAAYMVAVYLMHELCEHNNEHWDALYNVDWIIMPMVNPDGYEYTHSTYRLWRKNRRINSNSNCPGVDGNRNYGNQWRPNDDQCSEIYPGTEAFSEPETRAVRSIVEQYGSAIKVYISLHSYGESMLYPWGYEETLIDNWEQHQEIGELYAAAVYIVGGRRYTVGNAAIVLYAAYGGANDYMASVGVKTAFTVELTGGPENGFELPISMLAQVLEESWLGFREVAVYTSHYNWDN